MERCTDMEKIREITEKYLNTEALEYSPGCYYHPFRFFFRQISYSLFGSQTSSKQAERFYQDPKLLEQVKTKAREKFFQITPEGIISHFDSYKDAASFLLEAEEFLSISDLAGMVDDLLRRKTEPEAPMSKEKFLELLKACGPQLLMDKEEYEYYQTMLELKDTYVYRGSDYCDSEPTECFYWNIYASDIVKDFEDECWGGHSGYCAVIDWADIFALYCHDSGAVVVNPDKLRDIKDYYGFDEDYEEEYGSEEEEED